MPFHVVPIAALADRYIASRLGLAPRSADQLRAAARAFQAVSAGGFSDEAITAFLGRLLHRGLSPATVNTRRRQLLTLWQWAYRRGLCDRPPREVPRAREVQRIPEAWTTAEVSRLLRTAASWPGLVGPWPASDWWPALILTVYWTGARIGAVMAARGCDYDPVAGWLVLRQTKTGVEQLYRLHPQAMAALARVHSTESKRLFGWPHHPQHLHWCFRRIVLASQVRYRGGHCELFHRLRRTTVSYCAAVDPGLAQRQAGHTSYATTVAYYVDPTIAAQRSAADVLPVPQF